MFQSFLVDVKQEITFLNLSNLSLLVFLGMIAHSDYAVPDICELKQMT